MPTPGIDQSNLEALGQITRSPVYKHRKKNKNGGPAHKIPATSFCDNRVLTGQSEGHLHIFFPSSSKQRVCCIRLAVSSQGFTNPLAALYGPSMVERKKNKKKKRHSRVTTEP